jgi:ribonuclease-3
MLKLFAYAAEMCSSSDTSSEESSTDEEDCTMEELERKRLHPYRLHPEMWYNDSGEVYFKYFSIFFKYCHIQ